MTSTPTKLTVVFSEHRDLAGHYVLVRTLTGRTLYGTPYCKTVTAAREAATAWLEGYRQMEEASTGPTPLG